MCQSWFNVGRIEPRGRMDTRGTIDKSSEDEVHLDPFISHGSKFLEVPIDIAEEIVSTPIGGSYLNAILINQYGSRGRHTRQSSSEKLGVKSALVKKRRGGGGAGDFNLVTSRDERVGCSFDSSSTKHLAGFIQECGLVDLALQGSSFTWHRGGDFQAVSRLDMFLLSQDVLHCFPALSQRVLPRSLSDHNPVLLEEMSFAVRVRPFKWFSHWAYDPGYVELVKSIVAK
ncbi:hypothetical protein GQ457_03G017920 [Hibiscus cannabinus]